MTRNNKVTFTVQGSNRKEFVSRVKSILGPESARSFAIRAGIAPTTFNKVANGDSEPTRLTLLAIAEAAGVSLHWLIKGEGPKNVHAQEASPDKNTLDHLNSVDHGPQEPLDQDLLKMIVEELENFRAKHNLKWDAKQKSRLITLGYAMMLAEREKGNQVGPEMLHYLMQAAS